MMMRQILFVILTCMVSVSFAEIDINPSIPRIVQTDTVKAMVYEANPNIKKSSFYAKQHDGYKVEDKKGNVFYVDNIKNPMIKVGNHVINYGSVTSQNNNINMNTYIEKICFTISCQ